MSPWSTILDFTVEMLKNQRDGVIVLPSLSLRQPYVPELFRYQYQKLMANYL